MGAKLSNSKTTELSTEMKMEELQEEEVACKEILLHP